MRVFPFRILPGRFAQVGTKRPSGCHNGFGIGRLGLSGQHAAGRLLPPVASWVPACRPHETAQSPCSDRTLDATSGTSPGSHGRFAAILLNRSRQRQRTRNPLCFPCCLLLRSRARIVQIVAGRGALGRQTSSLPAKELQIAHGPAADRAPEQFDITLCGSNS